MPTLSFKVSADEAVRIRRAARSKNASISEYLRASALPKAAKSVAKYRTRIDKLTGFPVTVTPPGITMTSEQVRAVLAEFP
jgi:hypothetical protein